MARWWELMGEYDAVTDTFTAFAGGAGASPYYPTMSGKLKGLRAIANRDAASSLVDHVAMKLTSASFKPNAIYCGTQGSGLQTAPALQSGQSATLDWEVDQDVVVGTKIVMEGMNVGADTQVTVSALLYGLFEG